MKKIVIALLALAFATPAFSVETPVVDGFGVVVTDGQGKPVVTDN